MDEIKGQQCANQPWWIHFHGDARHEWPLSKMRAAVDCGKSLMVIATIASAKHFRVASLDLLCWLFPKNNL